MARPYFAGLAEHYMPAMTKQTQAVAENPPGAARAKIVFDGVCASFGAMLAIGPAHISIREGEFLAAVGPSGCGKSTFLNMIAGVLKPSAGTVLYNGAMVDGPNRDVGYITQKNYCLPCRTVELIPLEPSHALGADNGQVFGSRLGKTDYEIARLSAEGAI